MVARTSFESSSRFTNIITRVLKVFVKFCFTNSAVAIAGRNIFSVFFHRMPGSYFSSPETTHLQPIMWVGK